MPLTQIAIQNHSTVIDQADVAAAIAPLQKQVSKHFAPYWACDAHLILLPSTHPAPITAWQLLILDDADQADALGYHDLTPAGLPILKVFAKTAAQSGVSWTSVASHEILEALADPYLDSSVFVQHSSTAGRIWPLEICDPVESDLYRLDGVEVSNFVTPNWFFDSTACCATFDYLKKVHRAFEVRPGGYMEYFDVTAGLGWKQVNGSKTESAQVPE